MVVAVLGSNQFGKRGDPLSVQCLVERMARNPVVHVRCDSKTLRKNEHVRVDLLYASLSRNARLWVDIVGFVIFFLPAIFCLFMLSLPFFANSFTSAESSSNAGGLLLWPIKLVLPVGFGLLLLQGISELIKRIAALNGAGDFDPSYQKPLQ